MSQVRLFVLMDMQSFRYLVFHGMELSASIDCIKNILITLFDKMYDFVLLCKHTLQYFTKLKYSQVNSYASVTRYICLALVWRAQN